MRKTIFAFIAIAIFFLSSCDKSQQTAVDPSTVPATYTASKPDSVMVHFTKAVKVKHQYHACGNADSIIKTERCKAVEDSVIVPTSKPGEKFDFKAYCKANGITLVKNSTIIPTPVKKSSTDSESSEAKTSSKREPWDLSLGSDLLKAIGYGFLILLMILLALWVLLQLWNAIQRSRHDNTNNGGGGNQNRNNANIADTDRPTLTTRNSGAARYQPLPTVKKTTITETRTTVHEY